MAEVLGVSESGYYAWLKKKDHPSKRTIENQKFEELILEKYNKNHKIYGIRKIANELVCNRKRVARIMKKMNLRSKVTKKYKSTTYSDHDLPVAENILKRDFTAEKPGQKMVSDITYIPTDEGWLYLAAVMDLCGRKIVGTASGSRMTKELVCDAMRDAKNRTGNMSGCVCHSDRGVQYCSLKYQEQLKSYGCICSMSRKGNCWDNAPMECFWGKMKQEWLNEKHFKTREEAKKEIFNYIWIYYNRERIHASNGYLTPEVYYNQRNKY